MYVLIVIGSTCLVHPENSVEKDHQKWPKANKKFLGFLKNRNIGLNHKIKNKL